MAIDQERETSTENSAARPSRPKRRISKALELAANTLVAFTILGTSGCTAWSIWNTIQDRRQIEELYKKASATLDERFNPHFPSFNPGNINLEPDQQKIDLQPKLFQLRKETDILNGAFFEFAKRPNAELANAETTFRQIATEHLFDYLQLLNTTNPQQKAIFVNKNGRSEVQLDNEIYDLSNPLQFQTLFAVTSLKLETASLDQEIDKTTDQTTKEILLRRKSITMLSQQSAIWLKDQDIRLGIAENGILLASPLSFASFARTLQLTNDLGYPLPRTGIFGPNPKYGGEYLEKDSISSKSTIIDYLDPYGSLDSLVHETGHYVSDVSTSIRPQFSQSAFEAQALQSETGGLATVRDPKNVHYFLADRERNNRKEQYAELFAQYITKGKVVREKLIQLQSDDPAAAQILQAEYDFFKTFFQGREFIEGGFTQAEINQQIVKITKEAETAITQELPKKRVYTVGEKVTIVDKDTKRPGILLKDLPNNPTKADSPAVFDYDVVEIIEGPVELATEYNLDKKTMTFIPKNSKWWKVQLKMQGGQSYSRIGFRGGETGWIEEKWLGDTYKQAPSN
ncbi:MAG: hypothetical protein M1142_05475 [Patescibacteria group bacterium]|nr:hypothetical protein [Patescibacteria group bacterium]